MLREDKENAAGWGISCGVHIIILMIVAATGLFQAVSSESHPVDVEIYDNVTEDEQPSDDNSEAEAAPAASEPDAPQPDPIVVDQSVAVPEIETERKDEKEQPEKKQADAADSSAKHPAADAKPNAKGSPNGKPGGDADKPKAGPARDPAHVKHVKVHAQQLSTAQRPTRFPCRRRRLSAPSPSITSSMLQAASRARRLKHPPAIRRWMQRLWRLS